MLITYRTSRPRHGLTNYKTPDEWKCMEKILFSEYFFVGLCRYPASDIFSKSSDILQFPAESQPPLLKGQVNITAHREAANECQDTFVTYVIYSTLRSIDMTRGQLHRISPSKSTSVCHFLGQTRLQMLDLFFISCTIPLF